MNDEKQNDINETVAINRIVKVLDRLPSAMSRHRVMNFIHSRISEELVQGQQIVQAENQNPQTRLGW